MVNNDLNLGVGYISMEKELGAYYQDLKEAIYHIKNNNLGEIDDSGIPYLLIDGKAVYASVYVIQYALILHDIYLYKKKDEGEIQIIQKCLEWLDKNSEEFKDTLVWRSESNKQYNLEKGWVSAMYQGQAISLYLRAYQLFNKEEYLDKATKIYNFFKYDVSEGGAKRYDEEGNIWLEEYPTEEGSYVLNGYIYCLFGILDYYRVTDENEVKNFFDLCIESLMLNLPKYHRWYWSVYDRGKKQLVSFYYQKNVHIPLMDILFQITGKETFRTYKEIWKKQLNSAYCRFVVKIMYRVQPRLKRITG